MKRWIGALALLAAGAFLLSACPSKQTGSGGSAQPMYRSRY